MHKVVAPLFSFRRLLCLAFFLSATGVPGAFAVSNLVRIIDFGYQPINSSIHAGDSITWSNTTVAPLGNSHDSTHRQTPALWASPLLGPAKTYSFTFTNVGFYPYFCNFHKLTHPEQTGTVNVVTANLPPNVSLTDPTNNQRFFAPATFTLQANATDDVAVATVQFFSGANVLGSDSSRPYSLTVSNLSQNTYSFTAQAVDNQGARATSAVVTVLVENVPTVFIENWQYVSNRFSFRIRGGAAGERCDIQKSANLNGDWTTIGSAVFPATACPICPFIDFTDDNPAPDSQFYKIQVFP